MKDLKDYIEESLLDDFDTIANNMNMFDELGNITSRKKFIKCLKMYVECFEEFDVDNIGKYDKSTLVLSLRPFYDEGIIDYEEFTIDRRLLKSKKPIRIFYSSGGLMSHVCNLDYKAKLNDEKYKSYVLPENFSLHFKDWLSKTWPEKLKQVL